MTDDLTRRATRGAAWLGATNLVSKGVQMAVTVVLAATLTEAELGRVTVAVALVNVGQVVQSMGVFDVLARTERSVDRMAGTVLTLSLAVAGTIALAVIAGRELLAAALGAPDAAPLLAITAVSLPFAAIGGVQLAVMHRSLDFRRRVLPDAGSAIIGGVVTVVLALFGHGAYSLALGLLSTAVLQPVLGRAVGVRIRPAFDRGAAVEAVRWARVVGPAALVGVLLVNIDYPTVARLLGTEALGVYSMAFRIAWIPYITGAVVLGAVAFPLYTSMVRDGRRDEVPDAVALFTRAVVVLVGGMYVLIALLSPRIVVLDARWAPAVPVLLVLCVYGFAISLLHTWYEPTMAVGHPRWFLILELVRLVLLAAGLALLTPHGVVAAAAAQAIAAGVLVPAAWWAMRRAECAPPAALLWRSAGALALPAACAIAAWFVVERTVAGPAGSLPTAIGEGLLLVAVFGAAAYVVNRGALARLRAERASEGVPA